MSDLASPTSVTERDDVIVEAAEAIRKLRESVESVILGKPEVVVHTLTTLFATVFAITTTLLFLSSLSALLIFALTTFSSSLTSLASGQN